MADFENILAGAINMLNSTLSLDIITNLSAVSRGLLIDLTTIRIDDMCNFNMRNYAYMQAHMLRNLYEKEVTLSTVGENAYIDGDADNFGTIPQKPFYTDGNNYIDFMTSVRVADLTGQLTTRVSSANKTLSNGSTLFNNSNKYFDAPDGMTFSQDGTPTGGSSNENGGINYTGSSLDRNSILYKTQVLYRQNKIQSLISGFHTSPSVTYDGQVGSEYGESHGRNLLTKSAENGTGTYSVNGYDNPYCRAWTHHYMYDRLSRTMRANSGGINYWGDAFEWNEDDAGHEPSKQKPAVGENYDYAWRGKHNQDRRLQHSVLDLQRGVNGEAPTGLPIITPKYRGGESKNIHTKSCMFSIENLAWKDYDPYSFEQALSWEQRGPFGGRIMWFPPYNIKVTENATAKWNSNEFIGRGENVYTYINSERTGTLSFTLLTDHPSSIDYSSWWDGNGAISGVDDGSGASESDYLRYFAGCMGSGTDGQTENEDEDNIIEKPTPMTDEYRQLEIPGILGEEKKTEEININRDAVLPPDPVMNVPPQSNPVTVEFFMFFPNNYSGVLDNPANQSGQNNVPEGPKVDAIAYLLAGRNAQKEDGINDKQLKINDEIPNDAVGYEMGNTGITTDDCETKKEYLQGGQNVSSGKWKAEPSKKWKYRVDHVQPFVNGDKNGVNTLNQTLLNSSNMKDIASGYKYNLELSTNVRNLSNNSENLYTFAEVAAAMYSPKVLDVPSIYSYLIGKITTEEGKSRESRLEEIFNKEENRTLEGIECCGVSNQHGKTSRNVPLAKNRMNTIVSWIHSNPSWKDVQNTLNENDTYQSDADLPPAEKKNVNGPNAKLYRSARCVMKFSPAKVTSTTQNNPDPDKSKSDYFKMIPFWSNTGEFNASTVVQADKLAYSAVQDIKCTVSDGERDCSNLPELTDTSYWTPVNVREYSKTENYTVGEYVLYKDYVYEVLQDVLGELHEHKDAEFDGFVGFTFIEYRNHGDTVWAYYKKDETTTVYEQKANGNEESGEKTTTDESILEQQILDIFKEEPFCGIILPVWEDDDQYRGYYSETASYPAQEGMDGRPGAWTKYELGDMVGYENELYIANKDFACLEKYWNWPWSDSDWSELDNDKIVNYFKPEYTIVENKEEAVEGQLCLIDNVWQICTHLLTEEEGYEYVTPPEESDDWDLVPVFDENTQYNFGDVVNNEIKLYRCINASYTPGPFVLLNWIEIPDVAEHSPFTSYTTGDYCIYNDEIYEAINDIEGVEDQDWSTDLKDVISTLVTTDCQPDGEYDGNYVYKANMSSPTIGGDVCRHEGKYYVVLHTFSGREYDLSSIAEHPFDSEDWDVASDSRRYGTILTEEDFYLQKQAAKTLCWTEEKLREVILDGKELIEEPKYNDKFPTMWHYGGDDISAVTDGLNQSTVFTQYAQNAIGNIFNLTRNEQEYLNLMINQGLLLHDLETVTKYILLYRLLEAVTKIEDSNGNIREACEEEEVTEDVEELVETTQYTDPSNTEGCDNIWVDRGDGILIQECNIGKDPIESRFDPSTGEGDWNKLRYDQEYHFYRQYFADHPFVFDKLQDKIKYFNPAFHSMTPEGFNARLTFLHQCTRQGNTKTMSDVGGMTANNLAFGRPPFCILRLGDFYYQMIVIESISFDYSVSDGLQWDINPEGNGMQPMLCNVNINFKFVGGGDITGPVRRLQNAMSFNYYANTSFYDNRADRVQYQDTNWATMGGADNSKIDTAKSYAYQAQNYAGSGQKIYTVTKESGTKTTVDTKQ